MKVLNLILRVDTGFTFPPSLHQLLPFSFRFHFLREYHVSHVDLKLVHFLPVRAGLTGVHHHAQFMCWASDPGARQALWQLRYIRSTSDSMLSVVRFWFYQAHPTHIYLIINRVKCSWVLYALNECIDELLFTLVSHEAPLGFPREEWMPIAVDS